ncbi:MAG TPA: FtsQ-type POTRA domain-containing protein [Coleofasciculaceae cyanobacterium]|jgi:cell division septal protein FtsQ
MSGAEAQLPNQQPEYQPESPSSADAVPDLTVNEWEASLMGADQDPEKLNDADENASVFSTRSGIKDLLVKSATPPEQGAEATVELKAKVADAPAGDALPLPEPGKGKDAGDPGKRSRRQLNRVRRRQLNYLEKRREQKRRMVFYNRIRLIFKLCFALLWGALLWELLHSSVWTFSQPSFTLENQRLLRAEQLAPLVKNYQGQPIYDVNTGKIARKIKQENAIVDRVVVRRRLFPARLDIMVMEKEPWAEIFAVELLRPTAKPPAPATAAAKTPFKPVAQPTAPRPVKPVQPYAMLVPEGFISLNRYNYRAELYPGRVMEKIIVTPGSRIQQAYLDRLREIAWQARQIPGLQLVSLDIRNPQLVKLNFEETVVILGRMDNGASQRLARIIPLVPKIQELQAGINAVDLRWEEQVTFHTKPNIDLGLKKSAKTDG